MTQSGYDLPLSDIRVIDFSTTIAGPTATRHMSDFGAEVIKVESITHVDAARLGGPYGKSGFSINSSGYFSKYNAGKLSLALNMKKNGALKILQKLVAVSDVLVEAYRPGVISKWGITYETLKQWNPQIIMASHSLQGQSGPRSALRGYGWLASASTGWLDITGGKDESPVGPYSAYTDFISWPILLSSIILALEIRNETGEGSYIDHSHLESSAYFAAPEIVMSQQSGKPFRDGNHELYACPNNAYRCSGDDRWCAISVDSSSAWISLCQVLDSNHLATDTKFNSFSKRKRYETELDIALNCLTRDRDATELANALVERGVAAGEVYRVEDIFSDPQLIHRSTFKRFGHSKHGDHSVLSPAIKIDKMEPGPKQAFPLLGENTFEILVNLLGLSDKELESYRSAGVFE